MNQPQDVDGPRRGRPPQAWSSAAERAKGAFSKLDVRETVRRYPYAAIAVASGVGVVVGATLGSRLVRMLIGSVGMFTVSELLRRYAQRALDDLVELEMETEEPADEPR